MATHTPDQGKFVFVSHNLEQAEKIEKKVLVFGVKLGIALDKINWRYLVLFYCLSSLDLLFLPQCSVNMTMLKMI